MSQGLDAYRDEDCDILILNVTNKHRPIFDKKEYTEDEKRAIYRYLFSRRPQKIPPSSKNRLVNLYDPLADRSHRFPDGLRWCLNVYVGCEHNCGYCYVNGYSQESVGHRPHAKANFAPQLEKDFQALKSLGVPPAPLHMSNSTDPFQENLEKENRHTLLALKAIADQRHQFTSVVLLTKNPGLLCSDPYLAIIGSQSMRPLTVQITCAYWNDIPREFYEPKAPNVGKRLEAVRFLTQNGIDVELRVDPLFPSSRIREEVRLHQALSHYGLPEAQTDDDIARLVHFAKESGVKTVIAKPLKVPTTRTGQRCKQWFMEVYTDAHGGKGRTVRGGSWRLPALYEKALMSTVSDLCMQKGIAFKHCMHDVLSRC